MSNESFSNSEKVRALDRLMGEHKEQEREYEDTHDGYANRDNQIEYARLVVGNSMESLRQAQELVIPAMMEEDHETVVDALVVIQTTAMIQGQAYVEYMRDIYPEEYERQRRNSEEKTLEAVEELARHAHNPEEN